ncbi:hypothetical protein EGY05_12920 [Chryseobacterium arthrosphaerae]|uniref:hypothetical protein n=1 Tax=Chryseobacterium arthrosphaerae TaxID=651561 RepID=UPI000F5144BA|nr:hypothetical protein [Chryseobacterium arthrosphaerae]AYZ12768.1 hypothetical protein EGY05_12920 [Chryseobacterium arthrosphaerae]
MKLFLPERVNKGSFYYYFKNIDFVNENNEINIARANFKLSEIICHMMNRLLLKNKFTKVEYGYPISDLAVKMTTQPENFGQALKNN